MVEIDQRGVQRMLMRLFLRIEVTDRVTFFHGAGGGEFAGVIQNGFHQGGFSSRAMPDQGDVADGLGGVADHHGLLSDSRFSQQRF